MRKYRKRKKRWKRARKFNRHHIRARVRGGKSSLDNLIRLDINRHRAYHLLFGNMTFKEASRLLTRADTMVRKKGSVFTTRRCERCNAPLRKAKHKMKCIHCGYVRRIGDYPEKLLSNQRWPKGRLATSPPTTRIKPKVNSIKSLTNIINGYIIDTE